MKLLRKQQTTFLCVVCFSASPNLYSADFSVTVAADAGPGSLRQAIIDAEASAGSDQITFHPTLAGQTISLLSEIPINTSSGSIAIRSEAPGVVINAGASSHRIFRLGSGTNPLELKGITFRDGRATTTGAGLWNYGGAILSWTPMIIISCDFIGNLAGTGGGAIYSGANLTITNCRFEGNSSATGSNGGAIRVPAGSSIQMSNSIVMGNRAENGGGVFSSGSFHRCVFSHNSAGRGGALVAGNGSSVSECQFIENTGVYSGALSVSETCSITRSTFARNSAQKDGGAIGIANGSDILLAQCTLSENRSTNGTGGAIFNAGTLRLRHCTIAGNTANLRYVGAGGGIFTTGLLRLFNTIVAGNSASTNGSDILQSLNTTPAISEGGNLIGKNHTVSTTFPVGLPNANSDWVGSEAIPNQPLDPRLSPLGDFGGPTHTRIPLPGSHARDNALVSSPAFTSDQRGYAITGVPDIGAYETGVLDSFNASNWEQFAGGAKFDQDLDGDGLAEGIAFATAADSGGSHRRMVVTSSGNNGSPLIRYPFRPGARGLRYILQASPHLSGPWHPIQSYESDTEMTTNSTHIESHVQVAEKIIEVLDGRELPEKCFWRLKVENLLPDQE